MSFFTSWVAFSNKRKEYIISFCENYHTIFNMVMDIENWYSHWENRDIFVEEIYYDKILGEEVKQKVLSDKNKQSIRDILQLFERIRNFDYSCMSMVIDDYCSLFKKKSKERLKLKEMMGVISKVDYAYNSEEGLKFSLYRLNSYEESYMYEYFLKEKSNDVTFAFSNMPTLQSDLVKMTKINTYLKKINSDSKGKK